MARYLSNPRLRMACLGVLACLCVSANVARAQPPRDDSRENRVWVGRPSSSWDGYSSDESSEAPCAGSWAEGFHGPGTDWEVTALGVFDIGDGPALYIGGDFYRAGPVAANGVVRWDGDTWSPLGGGLTDPYMPRGPRVRALAVYDDGSGPALYVAGTVAIEEARYHPLGVARWNGSEWSDVGESIDSPYPYTLAVFDDGNGPVLYAGASRVSRWDGSSWETISGESYAFAYALAVFDDGTGAALYAAGWFTEIGGVEASNIARWNGASWAPLGEGLYGDESQVNSLVVHDDGTGPALYAAGWFTHAGGVEANNIACWDGASWSPVGGGIDPIEYWPVIAAFDDGNGEALYAGDVAAAGGVPVTGIARWDGTSWEPVSSGVDFVWGEYASPIETMAVFDRGDGEALYVGGDFDTAGEVTAWNLARWDGAEWSIAEKTTPNGLISSGGSFLVFDDGSGPALYVSGSRRWDGSSWSLVGDGVGYGVGSMVVFDDGTGPALYTGSWVDPDGSWIYRLARWDGADWSPLGEEAECAITKLTVHDDGSGPALYGHGCFKNPGGLTYRYVAARWDGAQWSTLGSGYTNSTWYVYGLISFDDGDGARLYAGGTIVDELLWWDGDRWQPAEGYQGGPIFWLEVIDDGRGPALYIAADDVFRYDGNEFEMLGPANYFKEVHALAWLDDGYDARLLAADGLYPDPDRLSEWDGVSWSQLGGDFDERVRTLAVFDHGTGPSVYAGGNFHRVGDVMSEHFARWDPPQVPCEEPTPVPAVSSLGAAVIVITLTAGLVYASRPKRCTRLQRSH